MKTFNDLLEKTENRGWHIETSKESINRICIILSMRSPMYQYFNIDTLSNEDYFIHNPWMDTGVYVEVDPVETYGFDNFVNFCRTVKNRMDEVVEKYNSIQE